MGKKDNKKNTNQIEEIIHYDDSLIKGSEISNEARIGFSNPSGELKENKISAISGNAGAEVNTKKKTTVKPKIKTQNVVNVLLISAVASGSTILGAGALLGSPSVKVSLFSKTSDSLTFQVDRVNVGEDDRLVASLFYNEEEISYDIYN